ncbi:MAG: organomercurial transporter MerC [Rhodoferax sp.]
MTLIARIGDKAGALGTVVSAMGCAACFPAIAGLGAAIGLGFLQQYEGLFISTLLPLFAGFALLANALGWLSHRQWHRSMLGMIGPALVLAGRFLWITPLLYAGIVSMLIVSIWDLVSPTNRRCGSDGCELPAKQA